MAKQPVKQGSGDEKMIYVHGPASFITPLPTPTRSATSTATATTASAGVPAVAAKSSPTPPTSAKEETSASEGKASPQAQDKGINPDKLTETTYNRINRVKLILPGPNRPVSDFCKELTEYIGRFYESNWNRTTIDPTRTNMPTKSIKESSDGCRWCVKNGIIGRIVPTEKEDRSLESVSFRPFKPEEFVTAIEEFFKIFAVTYTSKGNRIEYVSSISIGQAKIILASDVFRKALPLVERLFVYSIPLAVVTKSRPGEDKAGKPQSTTFKELFLLPAGFNKYREAASGDIIHFYCHKEWDEPTMGINEAKALLYSIYEEFYFETLNAPASAHIPCTSIASTTTPPPSPSVTLDALPSPAKVPLPHTTLPPEYCSSKVHALAHLLTPFCQILIGWRKKTPVWMFTANLPRSGKDYLAMISPIVHEGVAVQDPPLEEEAEFKRRITSAIVSGRRFQHMANCRGALDSPSLEAAITSEYWSDRLIGTSEAPVMINEIIFSLSYNGELPITPDLASRSRRVHLAKPASPGNKFTFTRKNLHSLLNSWEPLVKGEPISRKNVLRALLAIVHNWVKTGSNPGGTFTSFPEWAHYVGGILEAAGMGDVTTLTARDILKTDENHNTWLRFAFWFANNTTPYYTANQFLQIMSEYDKRHPDHRLFTEIAPITYHSLGSSLAKVAQGKKKSILANHCIIHTSGNENASYKFTFKVNFKETYVDLLDVFDVPSESPNDFLISPIPQKDPENPDPDADHE